MKYWQSAEVDKAVLEPFMSTAKYLESHISKSLQAGRLSQVAVEFCYIPIVMGTDFIDLFPARTEFNEKDKKIYHSPQLSYEIFKNGKENERFLEYLGGLKSAKAALKLANADGILIECFDDKITKLINKFRR